MTVLVIGATGTMGSLVVDELLARGATVRALVRDEQRAAHLPAAVERSVGDLRDPESVARALEGVRSAFYISPHELDEIELARAFVQASEARGVRLVMAGTHPLMAEGVNRIDLRELAEIVARALLDQYLGDDEDTWPGRNPATGRRQEEGRFSGRN
jgi:uncharacterized protein YbjT (DUF2867 family)